MSRPRTLGFYTRQQAFLRLTALRNVGLRAEGCASARVLEPRDSLTSRGASFTASDSDTRPVIASAKDFIVRVDEIREAGGGERYRYEAPRVWRRQAEVQGVETQRLRAGACSTPSPDPGVAQAKTTIGIKKNRWRSTHTQVNEVE